MWSAGPDSQTDGRHSFRSDHEWFSPKRLACRCSCQFPQTRPIAVPWRGCDNKGIAVRDESDHLLSRRQRPGDEKKSRRIEAVTRLHHVEGSVGESPPYDRAFERTRKILSRQLESFLRSQPYRAELSLGEVRDRGLTIEHEHDGKTGNA